MRRNSEDNGPREVIGEVTAKPEIAGYSQLGLLCVFLPGMLGVIFAFAALDLVPAILMILGSIVYTILGALAVFATGKHQTVWQFVEKKLDFRTGQQKYVKE